MTNRGSSAGLIWNLDDDRKTISASFSANPPVELSFNAADFECLINSLGAFRFVMEPEPSAEWILGQEFGAVPITSWSAEVDQSDGGIILHLRDPRYGWLHYVLPIESAQALAEEITAHSSRRIRARSRLEHNKIRNRFVAVQLLRRNGRRSRRNSLNAK